MKKTILACLLLITCQAYAQQPTTKDSLTLFYDSLFYHLQTSYLYTEETDWAALEPLKQEAINAPSFEAGLAHCTALFDSINGSHLNIFSDFGWYKWSGGREFTQADFHLDFLQKYESQPPFEVSVLNNQYGYILIPAMLMIDLTQDSLNRATQQMYDQIMAVVQTTEVKGWIIDLRFNTGGNVFPMVTALYHLLGNGTYYSLLDKHWAVAELVRMRNGTIDDDGKTMASITPTATPDLTTPVALITGILTGSSGELIPVSFRGRQHVTVIGEPSAGYLTGNSLTPLPFGAKLTLTTGYLADRKGHYTHHITPDTTLIKQANFNPLTQDPNIKAAIQFIEGVK